MRITTENFFYDNRKLTAFQSSLLDILKKMVKDNQENMKK